MKEKKKVSLKIKASQTAIVSKKREKTQNKQIQKRPSKSLGTISNDTAHVYMDSNRKKYQKKYFKVIMAEIF